jgi:hypothetical protein
MSAFKSNFLVLFVFPFFYTSCNAQPTGPHERVNRQPAVAGTFYPAEEVELKAWLSDFFSKPALTLPNQPLALIVPHAGYVFSGEVAASAFKQIDRNRKFKHIFVIGSTHTTHFDGVSIYTLGDFITPLGAVAVDTLAKWLQIKYKFQNDDATIHRREHSIEAQLPFLQYWLKNNFSIVPIIIGGESEKTCQKLADALKPFFNSDNLFVISSDFSHYPTYIDAQASDKTMAEAIISNSSKKFLQAKAFKESENIPNLLTAACGWTSILTLLKITENIDGTVYSLIKYQNSGDASVGQKNRVVGYNSLCAFSTKSIQSQNDFDLLDDEKVELLKIARKTIRDYVSTRKVDKIDPAKYSSNLQRELGAFVTLKESGTLRGCIGNFQPNQPLVKTIQDMAIAASTQDYRFNPVNEKEIPLLEIEISVLTPMKKIESVEEIEMGKHGIYIKKGYKSGTFLPQVGKETNWTREEFLGHCSRDKANIGWDGWKDAEIFIYEALIFGEKEFKGKL